MDRQAQEAEKTHVCLARSRLRSFSWPPPLACADGVESIPGAKESASAGSSGAKVFDTDTAVGADPDPSPASGLPADPAPDARP